MTVETVLALVRECQQVTLQLEGRCPGGEVGAFYASMPDGTQWILKWSELPDGYQRFTDGAAAVAALRQRGYPAPRYRPVLAVEGAAVSLQERLRGQWSDSVDHGLLDRMLEINYLQAGLAPGPASAWTEFIRQTLTEGAEGWCLHEPLRSHSPATAAVLQRIEAVGAGIQTLPGRDLVHVDFHHRNLLRDGGELIAVVDCEGFRSGDRLFDLVTFAYCLPVAETEDGVNTRLWDHVLSVGQPDAVAAYIAHMALRRLDWVIRHHPEEVPIWLDEAERRLAMVAA